MLEGIVLDYKNAIEQSQDIIMHLQREINEGRSVVAIKDENSVIEQSARIISLASNSQQPGVSEILLDQYQLKGFNVEGVQIIQKANIAKEQNRSSFDTEFVQHANFNGSARSLEIEKNDTNCEMYQYNERMNNEEQNHTIEDKENSEISKYYSIKHDPGFSSIKQNAQFYCDKPILEDKGNSARSIRAIESTSKENIREIPTLVIKSLSTRVIDRTFKIKENVAEPDFEPSSKDLMILSGDLGEDLHKNQKDEKNMMKISQDIVLLHFSAYHNLSHEKQKHNEKDEICAVCNQMKNRVNYERENINKSDVKAKSSEIKPSVDQEKFRDDQVYVVSYQHEESESNRKFVQMNHPDLVIETDQREQVSDKEDDCKRDSPAELYKKNETKDLLILNFTAKNQHKYEDIPRSKDSSPLIIPPKARMEEESSEYGAIKEGMMFNGLANMLIEFHKNHKEKEEASAKTIEELERVIHDLKKSWRERTQLARPTLKQRVSDKLDLLTVIKQENIDLQRQCRLKKGLLSKMTHIWGQISPNFNSIDPHQIKITLQKVQKSLRNLILEIESRIENDSSFADLLDKVVDLDFAGCGITSLILPYLSSSEEPSNRMLINNQAIIPVLSCEKRKTYFENDSIEQEITDVEDDLAICLVEAWSAAEKHGGLQPLTDYLEEISNKLIICDQLSQKISNIEFMISEIKEPYKEVHLEELSAQIDRMISFACEKSTQSGLGSIDNEYGAIVKKIKDIQHIKESPLRTPVKKTEGRQKVLEVPNTPDILLKESKVHFAQQSKSKIPPSSVVKPSNDEERPPEMEPSKDESHTKYKKSLEKYKEIVRQYDEQLKRDTEYISKLKDELHTCQDELRKRIEMNNELNLNVRTLEDDLKRAEAKFKKVEPVNIQDENQDSGKNSQVSKAKFFEEEHRKDKKLILKLERGLVKVADYTKTLHQISVDENLDLDNLSTMLPKKLELLDKMVNTLLCLVLDRIDEGTTYCKSNKVDPRAQPRAMTMCKDLRSITGPQFFENSLENEKSGMRYPLQTDLSNIDCGDITFKGGEKTVFSEINCKAFVDSLPDIAKSIQDRFKRLLELRKANILINEKVQNYLPLLRHRSNFDLKSSEIDQFISSSPLTSFQRRIVDLQDRFNDFMEGYMKKIAHLTQSLKESTYPRKDYLERLAKDCR